MTMDILAALFLLAGALTLGSIALAIVIGLFRAGRSAGAINFLLEVPAQEGQTGKASVSRLQMLIWNFVVAFAFLYVLGSLSIKAANGTVSLKMLEEALTALFNPQILILLGISNLTYLAGKIAPQGDARPAPAEGPATDGPGAITPAGGVKASDAVRSIPIQPAPTTAGPVG